MRRAWFARLAAAAVLVCLAAPAQSAITISPATLPNWTVNVAYSQTLSASGCLVSCAWSATGTLPTGLSLSSSGVISGTPSATGSFNFTVTAADLASSGSQAYTVVINSAPSITTASLPDGKVNTAYSQTVGVAGGTSPYSFSVSAGALPSGLTLSASSGQISGTPSTAGVFSFTLTVTDSATAQASQTLELTISANGSTLTITTTSPLPGGTVGVSYSQTLNASGGTQPYSWSITTGTLPTGLALNSSTGAISGKPSAAGTSNFTVQVSDSASGKASQPFALTINAGGSTLTITTTSPLPSGTVGVSYSQTLTASGGTQPYLWSVTAGNLPAGLLLNALTGDLAGIPLSAGTFTFTVKVTDANSAQATKQFTLTIASPGSALTITSPALMPDGVVGTAYSQTFTATGGTPPYSWSITTGALPAGLTLNFSTGAISGNPASPGISAFTLRVSDSASHTADKSITITVVIGPQGTPQIAVTGVPSTTDSAQQITFDLTLSSAYSKTVSGQITISLQPDAAAPKDDPAVQFSTGGRVVSFTFPPNTTHAQFPAKPMAFQTGTVAGAITLTVTSDLPGGNPDLSVVVARAVPVIRNVTVVKNATGFQVQVVGFSNSRELADVSLQFTPASGMNLQTTSLQVNLGDVANQWYASDASAPFGGQFLLVLPFTVQQGSQSDIGAVGLQLKNALGTSATASTNF